MEIGLVGQPNVGKSILFSRLTGIGAISSNYPGTTVEFQEGSVVKGGVRLNFHDLPGTYSLTGISEDEVVATRLLAEKKLDCVVAVTDATRLESGLVLAFQIMELGYKVVLALNFMDVARKRFALDAVRLEQLLGIPVVPIVAITGEGVDTLVDVLVSGQARVTDFRVPYDRHIEIILEDMSGDASSESSGFATRGALLKLLEGNGYFTERFSKSLKQRMEHAQRIFKAEHAEAVEVHISRDRFGEAGRIAQEVIGKRIVPRRRSDWISDLTLRPITGIPILLGVLTGLLLGIVFVGGTLESVLIGAYKALLGNFFIDLEGAIGGQIGEALARGLDLSLQAIISIVIPYIVTFYLMLGVLEDTGYLPRVVILLDGVMHRIGLHGRAIIPMIVGMGCNVPAILATRVLESRRERLILTIITVMAVPCSAQTAVILGTVGTFAGIGYAIAIYVILFLILVMLGRLLHKALKFEPTSLAIEIPDLTLPRWKNVLWKTQTRAKDFFIVAFPLLQLAARADDELRSSQSARRSFLTVHGGFPRAACSDTYRIDIRYPPQGDVDAAAGRALRYRQSGSGSEPEATVHLRSDHGHVHAMPLRLRHNAEGVRLEGHAESDRGIDLPGLFAGGFD
jgi:ferrous iron transport protein B